MKIYTDGSAHPNPGPGGFGVVICDDNNKLIKTYSKQTGYTTNNREEIKAILWALLNYGKEPNVIVYSDSNYCVQTFNDWMYKWANNNWIKSDKKIPENLDLISCYYEYVTEKNYKIDLRKIKGHANHKYNELADALATGKVKQSNGK